MSVTAVSGRPIKPAGGIEAAWLIPVSDVVSVTTDAGHCTKLTLRQGATFAQWPILEQCSSFREEILSPDGIPLARHTLTLVADPEGIRNLIGERQFARLATEGVIARIEISSGVFLLAGWSEKFGTEEPLRLRETRYESESKFITRPTLTLTFVNEDVTRALPIREQ